MKCIAIYSLILLLLVLGSAQAKMKPMATKSSVDGVYFETKPNTIFNGETWEETETQDCITIKTTGPDTAEVDILLVQANAHLCALTATAKRTPKSLVISGQENPETDLTEDCELTINILPDRFVFHDKDSRCRQVCGARAGFSDVSITRKHMQPISSGKQCSEEL